MHDTRHVIIVSDCKDVAFNEMKWAILGECHTMGINSVDIELVPVHEFSIINAAFLARLMAECCLPGTVISVVINPQKNRSARIFGETTNGIKFFGANTGALSWLLKDFHIQEVHEIHDPGFVSFGGKYVHAPNIAKLVANIPFSDLGLKFPLKSLTDLDIKDGTIVHIDNFGLMKIKGETPVFEDGDQLKVCRNGDYILDAVFAKRMMSKNDKEWVLYAGSSLNSMPELGTVRYAEGYKEISAEIGDILTWERK
ncbi:MAG: SAM-dependent chlorinase/fluorinase [Candidatus Moranbacteria bacterium]|nr:SAM-dependent chlorinase/fluorinase [Candidatus Moranbacteria bacterium]